MACMTCKLFDPEALSHTRDTPPDETLGSCNWDTPLPRSWRYARREVVATSPPPEWTNQLSLFTPIFRLWLVMPICGEMRATASRLPSFLLVHI